MPIAVGMYLPFGLSTPILIGGIIAHFYSRGITPSQQDRVLHRGVLFSSGVIAGEALTAVGLAAFAAIGITSLELGFSVRLIQVASIFAAIAVIGCFLRFTKPL